ncbi:hypothetical protein ROLI_040580 [Roseobacter fucihabitans]|uniref:histidine kinase n=1 Tax=Roseobacter fucihabitans TaxID=1537242 RepID=A0ABZ2BYJ0_9RHOB|nr:sensor histidine kinase [Roseobacter litoralis]MBC6965162.1 putative sensor histidine kinase pdtaS [Roseobacter litoralis]MBC6965835.1 putative sensor histidine kinase pdtaS [Roseobacter litoralis]
MTGGFLHGDLFRGLTFRILVFLSLALLPFGLIAIVQTRELARQADTNAELSLLGLTEQASGAERTIIQEGLGAAQALSSIVGIFADDPLACASFLHAYQQASNRYSLVGFLPANGVMTCSSAGGVHDFSDNPDFIKAVETTQRTVFVNPMGPLSGAPMLAIMHPHFVEGTFVGFATLSVPLAILRDMSDPETTTQPHDIITFNSAGEPLTSDRPRSVSLSDLPLNRSLKNFVGYSTSVFEDVNTEGDARVYTVVPIVPDLVYVIGIWRQEEVLAGTSHANALSVFLPVLMWIASLIVAFWSINRLAIGYIRRLGRQMRIFAFNRSLPRATLSASAPREFVEIQKVFMSMADSIIRDEASLENSLREKNILLKEVHHRVKNNLQLISSIMNMQIRRAPTEASRQVLRRLQERILSLATVHKNLYQNEGLDRVDAGALIEEIVGQLLVIGLPAGSQVAVEQSYASVMLDTDDAAPLTLLVSEAVTNAMKYIGPGDDDTRACLDISLTQPEPEVACFSITNSFDAAPAVEGTGLGMQLINAFARQLNAQVVSGKQDQTYHLILTFPVPHRAKPTLDY